MEPVEAKVRYVIFARALDVSKQERVVRASKDAEGHTILEYETQGYFIFLEGSRERLFLGWDEPNIKKGDKVRITIERFDEQTTDLARELSSGRRKPPEDQHPSGKGNLYSCYDTGPDA